MSPRKPNRLARNLKVMRNPSGTYYYYKMPDGKMESLGKDIPESVAIDAATALNIALADQESLVNRIARRAEELRNYNPSNPPMSQVLDEFKHSVLLVALEAKKQSKNTVDIKLSKLDEYMGLWSKMRVQDVRTFDLNNLLKTKTPHAQQKHVPLMRDIFRYAINAGYCDINPAEQLKAKEPEARKRQRHTFDSYMEIYKIAPPWLKRAMDIALYSLQRRSDLVDIQIARDIDIKTRSIKILQRKTRNYKTPVHINIAMGEPLWNAVSDAITGTTHCPYLIHCRPLRMDRRDRDAKPHPFAVLPDYLTKKFREWRDKSGAYNHLPQNERPSFHDIRALGIMLYFKAGYPKEYIMALAGHATEDMTNHYIDGHEQKEALQVAAGLDISKIDMKNINWKDQRIPRELAKLIDEEEG
ncbi:MAG: tyrosine-type recombinase/integrase [Marinomonas foliarum]|uniref:tyrosine-type recombinase/integrase n=1 Tax=Marinomonas foliarum TaxID=491950 RepID=UPI003F9976CB